MSQTHSLAEWASVLSLGIGVHCTFSVFWFLLVDAHRADFDLRPLLARALESGRLDPLLILVGPVKHDARHALADRLASSTSRLTAPKGATR